MKSHVGRYEIRGRLGKGGMAVVYRAYDPTFMREVAVKVLPAILVDHVQFRHRFQREARALASLEHSAIVPVYDYGESDNDPFLVMRLMKGGTLADRLKKGPLSVTDAIRVLGRISGALDKIHGHKVIHRDLKPSNILFDEDGKAYLTDFGIVKLLEARMELTATLDFMGTPAYMSPEQIGGQVTLDARSDVYSMGVMLYEMLTGELPYLADTPIMLAQMHLTEPTPRILEANPNLPPGCERIIQTAMAKNRNDRYWTAEEMVVALADAVSSQKAASGSPGSLEAEDSKRITETLAPTELLSREESESLAALAPAAVPSDVDVSRGIPPHADVSGSKRATPAWVKVLAGVFLLGLIGAGIIWGINLSRENAQATAEAEVTGTAVAVAQLTATGQSIMATTATAEAQMTGTAVMAMTQQAATATQLALIPTEVPPTNTPTSSPEPTELPAVSVCADFSVFEAGASVEGLGTVHPYLDIRTSGEAVALIEGTPPSVYVIVLDDGRSVANGGMGDGGFADVERIHDYQFLFASGVTVKQFSLNMLDYGDLNRNAILTHQVSLVAYDIHDDIVESDMLVYTTDDTTDISLIGDARLAEPGSPGNYTFTVSGNDIVRLQLQFLSDGEPVPSDLNFGLAALCFDAVGEPLVTPSPTPTQVAPTSTPTPPPAPVTSATQPPAPSCVVVNMTRTEWPNRAFDDVHMSWSNVPSGTDRLSLVVTGIIDGEEAYVVHPTFSDPDTPYTVELWMFEGGGFSSNSTFTFVIEALDADGTVLCTTRGTFDQ